MRNALCQVLKHGDEPSNCESSCACYHSYIEGLGLHVVYIARYVIRIKKHLHNRIEIKSNRKEYESLHPYSQISAKSKFAQKIPSKSAVFHQLFFGEVNPENSHEYVSENPAKFAFFHNLSY